MPPVAPTASSATLDGSGADVARYDPPVKVELSPTMKASKLLGPPTSLGSKSRKNPPLSKPGLPPNAPNLWVSSPVIFRRRIEPKSEMISRRSVGFVIRSASVKVAPRLGT